MNHQGDTTERVNFDNAQGAMRSSTSNAIEIVAPSYVVEEQDMHSSISTNTTLLPTKRRFDNHASGELQVGESSSIAAEVTLAKRRAYANDVNTSLLVPEMLVQPLSEVTPTRGVQASSPNQARFFIQNDTPLSFGSLESTATNSSQQIELVSSFHQVLHGCPRIDNMSTRNAPQALRLPYSQIGTKFMAPLHGQRNIQGSSMSGSQLGEAIQENSPQYLGFEETANLSGDFPNHSQQNGSLITIGSNVIVPNAPPRVHRQFNPNEPMQTLSRIVDINERVHNAGAIVFPRQSTESPSASSPSQSSHEMNLPTTIFNSKNENQHSSVATTVVRFGENFEPIISTSNWVNLERRTRFATEFCPIIIQQRSGHDLILEELLALYNSLVRRSIELHGNIQQRNIEQNNRATKGLTVEEIMLHIKHENFNYGDEETPKSNESCCICQEDYVVGEEVGRLDCVHKFHVECIKQWLMHKNVCPICKQIALAMNRIEDGVRENEDGVNA